MEDRALALVSRVPLAWALARALIERDLARALASGQPREAIALARAALARLSTARGDNAARIAEVEALLAQLRR